jgi:hypothetical protein
LAVPKERPYIDAQFVVVSPAKRRVSPPVTAEEFRSWSWPAKVFYVVGVALVLVLTTLLGEFIWGLWPS